MQASLDAFRKRRSQEIDTPAPVYGAGLSVPIAGLAPRRLTSLQEEFTRTPRTAALFERGAPEPVLAYRVTESAVVLPRCAGLKRFPNAVDMTREGAAMAPEVCLTGSLQPHQEAPAAAALKALRSPPYSAMVVLPCGAGKTFIALYVAHSLGRKTIVIVHKEFLVQQWLNRVATFLPKARVGILQSNREEVEDRDVVIAMLQSVAMRDYAARIFEDFGTCILDEAHHLAARLFSEVFFRLPVRHVLGLTATPVRKDGLTELLHAYMGPFAYQKQADGCDRPVHVVRIVVPSPRQRTDDLEAYEVQRLRTRLGAVQSRNEVILKALRWCAQRGRRTLLLSDRLAHLQTMLELFGEACPETTRSLYVGGMRAAARAAAEEAAVILATFSMAAEGLDIPGLDVLVLASPAHDVVQAVGRVLRPCEEKQDPVILDIVDDGCLVFVRAAEARAAHYRKQRFCVTELHCGQLSPALLDGAIGGGCVP